VSAGAERPSAWTIHGAFVLTGVVNTILGPVLPWLATRWALSDRMAGTLFTAEFAGGLVGGVASGWIAARWGSGRTMGAGMMLMALGVAATALGPWPVVVMGMAVAGLGLGFVIPPMNLLVARLEPARAAGALSALNLSWGVGAMTWPIGLAVLQPIAGTVVVLLILAAALAISAMRLAAVATGAVATHHPAARATSGSASIVVLFGILIVFYSGVEMAIGGWVTEYARRMEDLGSARPGQVSAALFWGGLTLGRAGIALRLPDLQANPAVFTGLAIVAGALSLLLLSSSGIGLAASALFAGVGLSPVFPVTIAAVARTCSPRVASALIALAALGGATVPWLVGAISEATASLAFGLAALVALVLVLIGGHALRVRVT
jgi:FHS family glucose/mannose:H+ symporter-like MFS transporter